MVSRFDTWVRSKGVDPDPRFTLANERTFLSWTTTCLGMVGVGLAIGTLLPSEGAAANVVALLWIVMSALLAVRAMLRWFVLERAMRENRPLPLSRSIPVVGVSLAVLSVASGLLVVLGS